MIIVTPKKKENTKMLKSSRVNQKLDEIRKRYMGNKRVRYILLIYLSY